MAAIEIHKELSATPSVIHVPSPGTTKLSFDVSGSGEVVIVYSIAAEKSARFLVRGKSIRRLKETAALSANPQTISKRVRLCRRLENKLDESFAITVIVKQMDENGEIVDSTRTSCPCAYYSEEGSETCE